MANLFKAANTPKQEHSTVLLINSAGKANAILIVGPLFFIQPFAGEVAEWSKALPC